MDRIVNSLKNNRHVFWEEIARDGAQAKTLLTANQRIAIAKAHGEMFNQNGPDHLIFAAGFISIAKEEEEIIRQMADEIDNCYIAVNCRSVKNEVLQCINAIKKAKFGRVAFVFPVSERLCRIMLHKTQRQALEQGVEIAKFALDNANGMPIDVQLGMASDADPVFVAEVASALSQQGVATVGLGDSRGVLYPSEAKKFFASVIKNADKDVLFSTHIHNDMGYGLVNVLETIKQGIMLNTSSWLGLGERCGLVRTELLTHALAYQPEKLKERLGIDGKNLFLSKPNLKMLPKIAKMVSEYTGIPLKVNDPIVGTRVNSISTGAPFVDTVSFQPFDPLEIHGIPKEIIVTQLASKRIIKEAAKIKGFELDDQQISKILPIVKSRAYSKGRAVFPDKELNEIFNSV